MFFTVSETCQQWGFWVKSISTPCIVFVGIIGNLLSLVVMKTKTLRHKSYSHYLCALAVFDTITLIIRLVSLMDDFYVKKQNERGLFHNFNDFSCKLYKYIEHVAYLMSSWLIVLMAVERLTAVWFPFKKVVIRRQTGAAITICVLVVVICVSQLFRLVMIEHITVDYVSGTRGCAASDEYFELFSSLQIYFYQWTLTFILPVVIVLLCNSLVIYQILKISGEVKKDEKNTRHNRAVRRKHHSTCMLLIVSFSYILTLFPLLILSLVIDISIRLNGPDASALYFALCPYVDVAVAISLLNYAINFFIYILSGKSFRYELGRICHKKQRTRRSFTARSTREEFIQL